MISVIIPIYNRDYCLSRCLESVLQQTFTNWECILIDDGSTDKTLSVCRSYVEKDPRFRVYSQPNGGVSSARNKGIEQACGEYIAFIDSDDWVEPEYLRLLNESVEKGRLSLCSMDEQQAGGYDKNNIRLFPLYGKEGDLVDFLTPELFDFLVGPICKLYEKSLIERYHIRFPQGISWGEDLIFNSIYLQYIDKVKGVPLRLYHIIKQDKSLTTDAMFDLFLTDMNQKLWQSVSRFFLSKGLIDAPFLNDYYINLTLSQIKSVRYVRNRLPWIERYKQMNYLVHSVNRDRLKKYRFKSIWILLTYYRLSALILIGYELYCILTKK